MGINSPKCRRCVNAEGRIERHRPKFRPPPIPQPSERRVQLAESKEARLASGATEKRSFSPEETTEASTSSLPVIRGMTTTRTLRATTNRMNNSYKVTDLTIEAAWADNRLIHL